MTVRPRASNVEWQKTIYGIREHQGHQCLLCGYAYRDAKKLEGHHVVHCASGGGSGEDNIVAVCVSCHNFIHCIAERDIPFMSRVMLAALLFGPNESPALFRILGFLFQRLLKRERTLLQLIGKIRRPRQRDQEAA